MVEKTVGETIHARRLHEALFYIQLHQRDALDEIPRYACRQQGAGLHMIFTHDEPHFGRLSASSGPSHPLQKAGDSKGRINLKGTLELSDIDAKLQRRSGADTHL